MKTIGSTTAQLKGFAFATLLLAFTSLSFGQFGSFGLQSNLNTLGNLFFQNNEIEVSSLADKYQSKNVLTESWTYDFKSWTVKAVAVEEDLILAVISSISKIDLAEVFFETELEMESWMTTSFESSFESSLENENCNPVDLYAYGEFYEADLELEVWMSSAFESSVEEDALILESWMTAPFKYN